MEAQHTLQDIVALVIEALEFRGATLAGLGAQAANEIATEIGSTRLPIHSDDCESLLDVPDGPRDCTCYISALLAQRDRLAAALREMLCCISDPKQDTYAKQQMINNARSALASLGGEAGR